jgi:hypothetical protein
VRGSRHTVAPYADVHVRSSLVIGCESELHRRRCRPATHPTREGTA